ncbi:hypothetical protein DL767_009789 [Monosporascus sp. MG133]|nr:hypothetical protein DL767_009789 [Monosporascus sp. MG133]
MRNETRSFTRNSAPHPLEAGLNSPLACSSRADFCGTRDASCKAGQAFDPGDATCGKNTEEEIARATPPGVEAQHAPSPGRLCRLSRLRPRDGKQQDSTPCYDSVSEGDGDDGVESPWTMPKSGRRGLRFVGGIRQSRDDAFGVDSNNEDEAEAARQTDSQNKPRYHQGGRRYNRAELATDENVYCPCEGSERDQDEGDNEDLRPPPRKHRRVRSNGGVFRPRQGRIRRSRCGVTNSPSSKGSGKGSEIGEGFAANFEERKISTAVLKTAIVDDLVTFQLDWIEDLGCAKQRPEDEDAPPTEINDQEEWEVLKILASRTYYKKLQYQVKWLGWDDDQEWYYAAGFKGPHLLKQYHLDYPEMPGPPVRLEHWRRAYEDGVEAAQHPDDNKPVRAAPIEMKTGATRTEAR